MRTRTLLAGLAVAAVGPACDSVPLLAPTQSTVRLVVAAASIPNGGSTTVTAAVTEAAGTPVHDGTVVTFSTTLGVVDPPRRPPNGGGPAPRSRPAPGPAPPRSWRIPATPSASRSR